MKNKWIVTDDRKDYLQLVLKKEGFRFIVLEISYPNEFLKSNEYKLSLIDEIIDKDKAIEIIALYGDSYGYNSYEDVLNECDSKEDASQVIAEINSEENWLDNIIEIEKDINTFKNKLFDCLIKYSDDKENINKIVNMIK